jgi:DNA-binding MarR family transcriptional regulator
MVDEPDLAILLVAANRCLNDRLVGAVKQTGARDMRPAFGFVIRAVDAEEPTVGRLAEMLGVSRQAASKLADEMARRGYLLRAAEREGALEEVRALRSRAVL